MSIQTFPSNVIPKCVMAFSSFKPPRLTYFKVLPFTSILAFTSNVEPALSSRLLSTNTFPSMIIAFAFSLDGASPLFTSKISNLSFILSALSAHSIHYLRIFYSVTF